MDSRLILAALIVVAVFGLIYVSTPASHTGNLTIQSTVVGGHSTTALLTSTQPTTSISSQAVYYIIMPTALGNMQNNNYNAYADYNISILQDSFLGPITSDKSSGMLSFSNDPNGKNQSVAVLYAQPGNITINLNLQPISMYIGGYPQKITTENSSQETSKENLNVYSYNRNYSVYIQLNYTDAKNQSYYFNGQSGVVICLQPSLSAIAGSYFVVLTTFNVSTIGNNTC
jgi:hypothetical protein